MTLGTLTIEMAVEIGRNLIPRENTYFTSISKLFLSYRPLIEDLFKGEIQQITAHYSIESPSQNLTLRTLDSTKRQIAPLLLRKLLRSGEIVHFCQLSVKHFLKTITLFKYIVSTRQNLAAKGQSANELVCLQQIAHDLVDQKRYAEALEVVESASKDKDSLRIMLVEDLANAGAIARAKGVARTITDPQKKNNVLEHLQDAEESGFHF